MTDAPQAAWTHGTLRNPTPTEPETTHAFYDEVLGPQWLRQLPSAEFIQVVAEAYRQQGYQVQQLAASPLAADMMLLRGSERILLTFEHRRIAETGVELPQRLDQAMSSQSANWGIAITACAFTDEARAYVEGRHLTALDGDAVAQLLSISPIQPVTPIPPPSAVRAPSSPTVTIPRCPVCQTAMVLDATDARPGVQPWTCHGCAEAQPGTPRRSLGRSSNDDEQWQGALGRWRQLSHR